MNGQFPDPYKGEGEHYTRIVPLTTGDDRITIRHENGNTVTGTPEQVLNNGHLKDGWKYVPTERIVPLTTGDDRIVPLTAETPKLDPKPWMFVYATEENQRSDIRLSKYYVWAPRTGYSQNQEDYT